MGKMEIKCDDKLKRKGIELARDRGALAEGPGGRGGGKAYSYVRELPMRQGDG
jgi:hypothetical protein